jgi:hypothetical protein
MSIKCAIGNTGMHIPAASPPIRWQPATLKANIQSPVVSPMVGRTQEADSTVQVVGVPASIVQRPVALVHVSIAAVLSSPGYNGRFIDSR